MRERVGMYEKAEQRKEKEENRLSKDQSLQPNIHHTRSCTRAEIFIHGHMLHLRPIIHGVDQQNMPRISSTSSSHTNK
jgi:hypothetical protein